MTSIDDVRPRLWTDVHPQSYAEAGERYQSAILEQYKIYVEMADLQAQGPGHPG